MHYFPTFETLKSKVTKMLLRFENMQRVHIERSAMLRTRKDKIEFIKNSLGEGAHSGLEISPSINPVIKHNDGFAIEYLDVCSTEELRDRAASNGRDLSCAPVINHQLDFNRTIKECVGNRTYDFVVTSHVVEHIPDLIGHFTQVQDVLNPGGTYAFFAPDKDLCFDCKKPETSLGQLIEAFVEKRNVAPLNALIDEYYYGVQRARKGGWAVDDPHPIRPKYGSHKELIRKVLSNPDQVKNWHGHIWRFTSSSFKALYQELYLLGLVQLKVHDVVATDRVEFVVILRAS